jgi:hypothetical protein
MGDSDYSAHSYSGKTQANKGGLLDPAEKLKYLTRRIWQWRP